MVNTCLYPMATNMISNEEYSYLELIKFEEEALGFNFNYTILELYKTNPKAKTCIKISDLDDTNEANVLVQIKFISEITTRKQEQMSFITITDGIEQLECLLFPNRYNEIMRIFNEKSRLRYDKDVCILRLRPNVRNNNLNYEIINAFKFK